MAEAAASAIDARLFRSVLGQFATGITVVTCTDEQGEPHGMTANSFVSISLEPPLVLVSVDVRTRMQALLARAGRYGVSVLREDQRALSDRFAGRAGEPDVAFGWHDGVPVLDGALATLVCRVRAAHDAGDHCLHVGEVECCERRDGAPLLFHAGRYARVGANHLHEQGRTREHR